MAIKLNPYISFRDNAREAMEFYKSVLGGELTVSTFGEFQASEDPAEVDKVMHAQLVTDGGLTLMAADTPNSMDFTPGGSITVSLSGDDDETLSGYWQGLSDGATVVMPFELAPWGDRFGLLTDKYGVSWMVDVLGAGTPPIQA